MSNEDLIDACVMECYFREHMAERDMLFLDDLAPRLASVEQTFLSASASETARQECLAHLHLHRQPRPARRHQSRGSRVKAQLHRIEIRNFKVFREFTLDLEDHHK